MWKSIRPLRRVQVSVPFGGQGTIRDQLSKHSSRQHPVGRWLKSLQSSSIGDRPNHSSATLSIRTTGSVLISAAGYGSFLRDQAGLDESAGFKSQWRFRRTNSEIAQQRRVNTASNRHYWEGLCFTSIAVLLFVRVIQKEVASGFKRRECFRPR